MNNNYKLSTCWQFLLTINKKDQIQQCVQTHGKKDNMQLLLSTITTEFSIVIHKQIHN